MKENVFTFDAVQFNKLFPFYILLNKELEIIDGGKSLLKLYPDAIAQPLSGIFTISRPSFTAIKIDDLQALHDQPVVLKSLQKNSNLSLRGQFEFLPAAEQCIFVGSPIFNSVDELTEHHLSIPDFANHDASIDLLHLVKAKENISEDLKELLKILHYKKEQQHREQQEIKRLSLVASLNESGVIFINRECSILWSNEGFSNFTGYAPDEILNKFFYELGDGPLFDKDAMFMIIEELEQGKTIETEFAYYKKNGQLSWCKGKGQPIPGATGADQRFFMIVEDVTDKRQQDEKLKILSLIAEDNINAVIIADADGRIEWVNKSFTNITGYHLNEVKGKKPGHLLQGGQSSNETKRFMHEQLSKGNDFNAEIVNYSKDGRPYWINVQCQAIKDASGKINGFFAIEEDITEKKLSSQRLQESEKRLSALITNLHSGILVEDENRKIVLANALFCEMFNIAATPEMLTGTDRSQLALHADEIFKKPADFIRDIEKLLDEKKLVIDDILQLQDGRYFSRDYIPIYIEDVYRGHLWKYTDITAQKHAENALLIREEKYRGIIANMNLGLLEVDTNEIIQFANNSFCEMSGYSTDELIGNYAPLLFIDKDALPISEEKNIKRVAGVSDAYEMQARNKKGEPKWWLISGAPRYNDDGEMVGSIGIHLDITDHKLMEVQLKAAKEVAENAQAAEQEFLANMSHEIRTPLNAIAGMTYLLQDTPVSDEQQEYLDVVQSSTDILLRLVTNILDISKIEAGKIEANIKEIDIMHLLKGLEKTIRIQHKNSDVKIVFEYPGTPAHYMESDDLMITQVLLNLLSNASKFTTTGQIKLQAELYSNHDDKVLFNVMISDTGKGMSKQEQNSIFEKFVQGGDEDSRAKGTGLGLAITKKLIEFLKGTIYVQSREGEGTKFTISIPMRMGKSALAGDAQPDVTEKTYNLAGVKVLVAEDNEVNRKYIGKLLSKWGVNYKFAVNGQEAVDMLSAKDSFDMVLMDLQMPVKDGIEATLDIRSSQKWYSNIPVIGVSATAIIGLKQKARESGINDFVTKPYTPIQLQSAMGRHLKAVPVNVAIDEFVEKEDGLFEFSDKLNTRHLKELIDGDFEYAKVLFEIFENTIVPQIEDVKRLYSQNDCAAFSRLIHKIKPTFAMVGIPGFDGLLQYLETQSGSINDLTQLQVSYEDFLVKVGLYIPVINHEKQRLENYLAAKQTA